jgi:hypothetical protein
MCWECAGGARGLDFMAVLGALGTIKYRNIALSKNFRYQKGNRKKYKTRKGNRID